MSVKEYLRNTEIESDRVMVVDQYGKACGEMTMEEALAAAFDQGLDLILVAPGATPPVCRIADYGKFIYNAEKKEKNNKKKQKVVETKEIRITPGIATNDILVKSRAAQKFLDKGNKVKIICRFHGREAMMPEEGRTALTRFTECLGEAGRITSGIISEGRNLSVIIGPVC